MAALVDFIKVRSEIIKNKELSCSSFFTELGLSNYILFNIYRLCFAHLSAFFQKVARPCWSRRNPGNQLSSFVALICARLSVVSNHQYWPGGNVTHPMSSRAHAALWMFIRRWGTVLIKIPQLIILYDAKWENATTIKQYLAKLCCDKSKVKDRCVYNNYWPVCQ